MGEEEAVPGTILVNAAKIYVIKDAMYVTFTGEGSCNILHADGSATRWTERILCSSGDKCYVLKGTVGFEKK